MSAPPFPTLLRMNGRSSPVRIRMCGTGTVYVVRAPDIRRAPQRPADKNNRSITVRAARSQLTTHSGILYQPRSWRHESNVAKPCPSDDDDVSFRTFPSAVGFLILLFFLYIFILFVKFFFTFIMSFSHTNLRIFVHIQYNNIKYICIIYTYYVTNTLLYIVIWRYIPIVCFYGYYYCNRGTYILVLWVGVYCSPYWTRVEDFYFI